MDDLGESRTHFGVIEIALSRVDQILAQMIDLVERVRISIGVDDHVEKRQETEIDKDFSKNGPHLDLFQPSIARIIHFRIVQMIGTNRRTIGKQRFLLQHACHHLFLFCDASSAVLTSTE